MVDFILFCAIGAAFFGGWWCRGKFSTFGEAVDAGVGKVKGWFA